LQHPRFPAISRKAAQIIPFQKKIGNHFTPPERFVKSFFDIGKILSILVKIFRYPKRVANPGQRW
jgi:hypothetical protein